MPAGLRFTFPGHGSSCGKATEELFFAHAALDGSFHVRRVLTGCDDQHCPDHWHARWLARATGRIVKRLRRAMEAVPGVYQRWVVSPPPTTKVETEEQLDGLYNQLYSILYYFGGGNMGGVALFHHTRIPSKFNAREDSEEGPHFHCFGRAWIDPNIAVAVFNETGWVIKGMGAPDSWHSSVEYVLSHLAIPHSPTYSQTKLGDGTLPLGGIKPTDRDWSGKLTIRWFGRLSYNKFSEPDEEIVIPCPICGIELTPKMWTRVDYTGKEGPPPGNFVCTGGELVYRTSEHYVD